MHPHSRDIRATSEDTDEPAIKITREELWKTVEKSNFYRTDRIGAFKEDKNRCWPITVKSSQYKVHDKVFKSKKNLKGKR